MHRRSFLFLLACASVGAQPSGAPSHDFKIEHQSTEELPFKLSWWGSPSTYYFILQSSDLADPTTWSYYDCAIKGVEGPEGYGQSEAIRLDSDSAQNFFRLSMPEPGDPILSEDFDEDKVPNGPELDTGLDPFSDADDDSDTIPDDWERFHLKTTYFDENSDFDDDGHLL